MGKGNVKVEAAADLVSEDSDGSFGNIVINKRINRQIEEGMYGEDFFSNNLDAPSLKNRGSIVVEMNANLDEVDEDAFDRIIDEEKAKKRNERKKFASF